MPLDALAQLADKVMEVALPSVSAVNVAPLTSEDDQLRAEVGQLRDLIFALQSAEDKIINNVQHRHTCALPGM